MNELQLLYQFYRQLNALAGQADEKGYAKYSGQQLKSWAVQNWPLGDVRIPHCYRS